MGIQQPVLFFFYREKETVCVRPSLAYHAELVPLHHLPACKLSWKRKGSLIKIMIMNIILNEENICIGPAFVAGEDRALWLAGWL